MTLPELGELNRGKSKHRPRDAAHLYGGPYPFLQTGDIKNARGRVTAYSQTYSEAGLAQSRLWPEGTVAITIAANIAETSILTFPACFPDSVVGFVADPTRCDARFIEYSFQLHRKKIQGEYVGSGSVQDNINLRVLSQLKFLVPPLWEQKAIAEILGSLDDKIELNRRLNETLEAMTQAIFRDWFVDFGPTRRKIDGATDPVEIIGGLVSDPDRARELTDLFPASMDDGLPEGWVEGDLAHYAFLNPESWSARNAPNEVEYVDLSNAKWGTIETITAYRWLEAPSRARRIVRKGDTIVGTVRPGNGSYSYVRIDGLTASTGFAALRPKRKTMAELVYLAATSCENIARLDKLADGGAYPAVRPDVVLATSLPVVPPDTVDGFSSVCAPLIDRIEHNKEENRTLAGTRDLFLPKLMSGKIRLRDAEREIEAVA